MLKKNNLIIGIGFILVCITSCIITYFMLLNVGALKDAKVSLNYQYNQIIKEYDGKEVEYDIDDFILEEGSLKEGHNANFTILEKPILVGNYKVDYNVVIKNNDGYDVSSEYKIKTKPISIKINAKKLSIYIKSYDPENLTLLNNDFEFLLETSLVEGHKIAYDITRETVDGILNEDINPYVIDSNGNIVTNNYIFDFVVKEKDIIDITIKTASASKIYDGQAVSANYYEITNGKLKEGNYLEIGFSPIPIINAGSYTNKITNIKILNRNGFDVTYNYKITYDLGTLEIAKKDITIFGVDYNKEYDGLNYELKYYNNFLTEGLISGHHLEIIYDLNVVKDAGIYVSDIKEYAIYYNNSDVTSNYNVTHHAGSVIITKRTIIIETPSISKVYDGTPLEMNINLVSVSNLINTHKIALKHQLDNQSDIYNKTNEVSITSLNDEDGISVINNYNIQYKLGIAQITQRNLTVEAVSGTKEYDGLPFDLITNQPTARNLVSGQTLIATHKQMLDLVDSGIYNSEIDNCKVILGEKDLTKNYNIEFIKGKITIEKRVITISTPNIEKEYDGKNFELKKEYVVISNLLTGHEVDFTFNQAAKSDICMELNSIQINSITESNSLFDVKKNYKYVLNFGILKIVPRNITIEAISDSKVYDGLPYSFENNVAQASNLITGHSIEVSYKTIDDVNNGTYNSEIASCAIKFNNQDVTSNYNISLAQGKITIEKKVISIAGKDISKVYDGKELMFEDINDDSKSQLISNHTFRILESDKIINVLESTNNARIKDWIIIDELDSSDMTNNYIVKILTGSLKIEKKQVTVVPQAFSKTYDGTPINFKKYSFNNDERKLIDSHTFYILERLEEIIDFTQEVKNYSIDNYRILDEYDRNVTSNYLVTSELSTLEIKPRALIIETESFTKYYDGEFINCGIVKISGLLTNHIISGAFLNNEFKDIGKADNDYMIYDIYDANKYNEEFESATNASVLNNYFIDYSLSTIGTLTILNPLP